jgi:hypothetical protein
LQPLRRLGLVTVLVLLAHALVLGGLPSLGVIAGRSQQPPSRLASFVTRTLPAPTPPVTAPPPVKPVPAKKRSSPAKPAVPMPLPSPTPEATMAPVAAQAPAVAEVQPAPVAAPEAPTDAQAQPPVEIPAPAATVAEVQPDRPPVPKLAYAQPARLVYDGRGEEQGYIKYAASAELLWLPEGAQYSARLEISAWGFRLRTWTSRGTLGEAGLMPTRFGDKPRGAEQATHFQRDKGIISFSANNPDVALQDGAQDKLSALLQLSALVGGEPERYSPGTVISFQAADAHRAEPWQFKVGSLEPLELPGGTLNSLKLSREPTLQFDQRIEVWLAPEAHYLPVRLRITEANGAFADLLWRNTQKPD